MNGFELVVMSVDVKNGGRCGVGVEFLHCRSDSPEDGLTVTDYYWISVPNTTVPLSVRRAYLYVAQSGKMGHNTKQEVLKLD
jgi:hypothetical protein